MPLTQSARKALRQSQKRRTHNLNYKRTMKRTIKQARILITQNKPKEAYALLPGLYTLLDKSAKKNIIKKNTAARYKSRITRAITISSKNIKI